MESALLKRTSPELSSESNAITSDILQRESPDNNEQEKRSNNGDTDAVSDSLVAMQNSPIDLTKTGCNQEAVDTVISSMNGDGDNSSAIIPLELSGDVCSETCQQSDGVGKSCNEDHVSLVLKDLINDVVGSCEVRCDASEKIADEPSKIDQNCSEVISNGSGVLAPPSVVTNDGNQEGDVAVKVLCKDVNDRPPPERELRISLESLERSSTFFEMSHRLPQVVIDLRQTPLVQVCTIYSAVDNSAASSSSNGRHNATVIPRRPQTAIRGRNKRGNYSTRHPTPFLERNYPAKTTNHMNHHSNSDNECAIVQTESPNEDLVCSSTRRSLRSAGKTYQGKNDIVSDGEPEPNSKRYRKTSGSSSESDRDTMKVQTVNRTYARYSYTSQMPVISTEVNEATKFKRFSSSITWDGNLQNQHHDITAKKPLKLTKTTISGESGRQDMFSKSNGLNKSKSHQSKLKIRTRIGPAWYSRKFLSSPPSQSNQLERINMSFAVVKRQTYILGQRHCPLPRHGKLPLLKKKFKVQSEETSEFDNVGHESLILWRMSLDDVEELQSQLMREAEHRRVDRAMPVVMQLSDDQIESAYKCVAESMNTFEIVAVDSEEEETESDEEDANEDKYVDILDEYHRMVAEREKQDNEKLPAFETEYARTRPKRLAVDYGPSAFAPIMLMEGRRLSTGHSAGNKSVSVPPKSTTKTSDSAIKSVKRKKKSSHCSSKVQRKKHPNKTEDDEMECVEIESATTGITASMNLVLIMFDRI